LDVPLVGGGGFWLLVVGFWFLVAALRDARREAQHQQPKTGNQCVPS
jgi:hypothetical protein